MNWNTGTIIELLKSTPYLTINKLCQTNKQFRKVCQSDLGVKIILSKLEQLPLTILWAEMLTFKYPVVIKFCQLSPKINKICQYHLFWEQKYKRDFPSTNLTLGNKHIMTLYEKAYYDRKYTNELKEAIRNNDQQTIKEALKATPPDPGALIEEAVKSNNIPILDLLLLSHGGTISAVIAAIDTNNINIIKHVFEDFETGDNGIPIRQRSGYIHSLLTSMGRRTSYNSLTAGAFHTIIQKNPSLEIIDYIADKLHPLYFEQPSTLNSFLEDAARINNIDMIKLLIRKFGHLSKINPTDILYQYLLHVDASQINSNIIELFIAHGADLTNILYQLKEAYHTSLYNRAPKIKTNLCYLIDHLQPTDYLDVVADEVGCD